jgi:hypothetical protein
LNKCKLACFSTIQGIPFGSSKNSTKYYTECHCAGHKAVYETMKTESLMVLMPNLSSLQKHKHAYLGWTTANWLFSVQFRVYLLDLLKYNSTKCHAGCHFADHKTVYSEPDKMMMTES